MGRHKRLTQVRFSGLRLTRGPADGTLVSWVLHLLASSITPSHRPASFLPRSPAVSAATTTTATPVWAGAFFTGLAILRLWLRLPVSAHQISSAAPGNELVIGATGKGSIVSELLAHPDLMPSRCQIEA